MSFLQQGCSVRTKAAPWVLKSQRLPSEHIATDKPKRSCGAGTQHYTPISAWDCSTHKGEMGLRRNGLGFLFFFCKASHVLNRGSVETPFQQEK